MRATTPADRGQPSTMKPGSAWLSDREVRAVVAALRRLSHACEVMGTHGDADHLAEAIRLDELARRIERRAGASPRKAFVVGLDPQYALEPVRGYRTNEHSRRSTGGTED